MPVCLEKNTNDEFSGIIASPMRLSGRAGGAGRTSVTVSPGPHAEEWGFAAAFGGGLDVKLGKHAAARVFQVQYTPMNQVGTGNNTFQASAGIGFYAGKK
jgi:hypothetical protein